MGFFLSCVCYLLLYASVYLYLVAPAEKGLTTWLSFVVSYSECVTFQLVS